MQVRASLSDMLENRDFKLTIVTADTGKEADIKKLCDVARTVRDGR